MGGSGQSRPWLTRLWMGLGAGQSSCLMDLGFFWRWGERGLDRGRWGRPREHSGHNSITFAVTSTPRALTSPWTWRLEGAV